jgi:hypothetical protein
MSREDVFTVIGRSRIDLDFNASLLRNFADALKEGGYHLDNNEVEQAKRAIMQPTPHFPGWLPQPDPAQIVQIRQEQTDMLLDLMKRRKNLTAKMHEVVEQTFNRAVQTYYSISLMNKIMFATGIGLFIFSALYAVIAREKVYSLLFGGLGVASFVSLFLLGPVERIQKALSNLVQVEIAFMTFFDQIIWWEQVASTPGQSPAGGPDKDNLEKASKGLHSSCQAIIELLETYVESPESTSYRSLKKRKLVPAKAFAKGESEHD